MREQEEDTLVYAPAQSFADTFFVPADGSAALTFGAATHVGHVRARNEDQFAVLRLRRAVELLLSSLDPQELQVPETSSYSLVVADGMGGMKSGDYASRLALQTMLELTGQASSWVMRFRDLDAHQIQQRAEAYVKRIHTTLQEHSHADASLRDMGTTWTSAHLCGLHAVIVHLGDSRAYLMRGGQLEQVTRDQTMAQDLIDAGMEPNSVKKFGHVLTNSFGGGSDSASATVLTLELQTGDQLLLCTDGLTDMVADAEIAAECSQGRDPQATCDVLVQRALTNGGKDNVTVVLAQVDSPAD